MRAVLSLVHKFVHKNNGAGWNAVYRWDSDRTRSAILP